MKKRAFIRSIGYGLAGMPFSSYVHASASSFERKNPFTPTSLYPKRLKAGDTVGIISPSAATVDELSHLLAQENFEALGLNVRWGANAKRRYGHLAGQDEEKLADIHGFFADTEIKALICLRGGSGAARLLDQLDYKLIARNPKIFLGYSDITAIHNAINSKTGLITFHGPVGISDWTLSLGEQFHSLFFEGKMPLYRNPVDKGDSLTQRNNRTQTIYPGSAKGRLLGGNLSVLTGIAGSDFFPDFTDSILFLEDVDEEPYRVENMFAQLRLNGVLSKIKGFIFGKCTNCEPHGGYGSLTIDEILDDYIKPLRIPAFKGAMIGHIRDQFFYLSALQ